MHFKDAISSLPAYKPANLTSPPSGLVKLSSNENALGPSPRAVAAMHEALNDVHRYPDAGAWVLRRALAEQAGLAPEMVMCGNGSDELVLLTCIGFLRAGDSAVMANGTFISYLLRTLEMGGVPIRVPLRDDYTHDLPAMLAAITPQTRLVFVCNPNNPTGTTVGAAEVRDFIARVPADVLIVMDEAYIEFVNRADYPDLRDELRAGRHNLLLLRTFAKIYGLAGLRLGYAYGHADLIAYLERTRPTFNVNALAQIAGSAALTDKEHVTRSKAHADASRAYLTRELTALGLQPIASDTNFVTVAVGDDAAVSTALAEQGFLVNPLTGWGLPGLIRITFGTDEQNERFVAALRTVLAARVGA